MMTGFASSLGWKLKKPQSEPAMRVVRSIEKEDRNQKQRRHANQRKHDRRMPVALVVDRISTNIVITPTTAQPNCFNTNE